MRTAPRSAAVLLGIALLSGACDQVDDVSEQVGDVVDTAEFCIAAGRAVTALNDQDAAAAEDAIRDAAAEAPDEIQGAIETLREAVRQAREGDTEALAADEVRAAADEVRTFVAEECDPR